MISNPFHDLLLKPCYTLVENMTRLADKFSNKENLENINTDDLTTKINDINSRINTINCDLEELLETPWNQVKATPEEIDIYLQRRRNENLFKVFVPYMMCYQKYLDEKY